MSEVLSKKDYDKVLPSMKIINTWYIFAHSVIGIVWKSLSDRAISATFAIIKEVVALSSLARYN